MSPTVVKKSKSSGLSGYASLFIYSIASNTAFGLYISREFAKSPTTTKLKPFFFAFIEISEQTDAQSIYLNIFIFK